MKTIHTVFVDQPIAADPKPHLLQLADQVEREGWIDTSLQLVLALCVVGSLAICGLRAAAPTADPQAGDSANAATLAVRALEAKTNPSL